MEIENTSSFSTNLEELVEKEIWDENRVLGSRPIADL